jgi:N-acetylmuramoyl-L-alanine amidase
VEHANFVVLRSPDVPSILVETAFITNPAEEARLKTGKHRERLAAAILDGVDDYFRNAPPPGSLFARQGNRDNAQAANYVVNRGDTLSAIAASHGVSIAQLRDANQLADERVRAGEVLRIPSG